MTSFFDDITFLRPLWLIAVIAVFAVPKIIKAARKKENNWIKICHNHLLGNQIAKNTKNDFWLITLCITVWLLLILALAGFSYEKTGQNFLGNSTPTVIALSLASSMDKTDETPSRLVRAWFVLNDILDKVNNEKSLVIFTDEPYAITPLTDDKTIIKNFLPLLRTSIVPSQGKRIDRAIDFSCNLIKQAYYSYGNVILLTDEVDDYINETLAASSKAAKNGCKISVLALGEGEHNSLRQIAKNGGGNYLKASNDNLNIELLLKPSKPRLILSNIKKSFISDNLIQKDNGYIFIPIILVLLMPFFRKGFLIVVLGLILVSNKPCYAFDWQQLIFSKEQIGAKLIETEKAEKSLEFLSSPLWRGGAFYKLQKYDDAAVEYLKAEDETSLYNLGNTLAWQQKFLEAINAYDQVLATNPNHSDAYYNREIVKKLLEQNPPPPPPSSGGAGDNLENGEGDGGNNPQGGNQGNAGGDSNNNNDNNDNNGNGGNGQSGGSGQESNDNQGEGEGKGGSSGSGGDSGQGDNNSNNDKQNDNQQNQGGGNQNNQSGQGNQGGNGKSSPEKNNNPPTEDEQSSQNIINRIPDDPEALLRHKLEMIHSLKRYQ